MPLMAATINFDEALAELEQLQHTDMQSAITKLHELEADFEHMTRFQQGRLLVFKGTSFIYSGQYQEALDNLIQSENLVQNSDYLFSAYSYEATAYIALRNFKDAFVVMSKSLGLIDRIDNIDIKRAAYLRLAGLYSAMGIKEEVETYAAKALSLTAADNVKDICTAKLYLSVYQLELEIYDKAFDEFQNTHGFCESNGFPLISFIALKGMGESKLRLQEYSSAIALLLKALKGYESFNFQLEINSVHSLLAEAYFSLKQFANAVEHAKFVTSLPNESSYTELKHNVFKVLAGLNAENKQFEQAYEYSKKEQYYNQLMFDEAKMKTLAYQAAKFNADEQAREINLLNKERELYIAQQTVKEREYTNMLMFVTILVGGLFFLGILLAVGQMQKRKFMRMARMDALTGILNRGAGQELGENLFVQVTARGGDFSVILFDLDFFKRINDSFGHGTGDWALKKVVDSLKSHIRNGDVFARIGGEEFAILLPYADEEKAMEVAEQCRARIEAIDTQHSGHKFVITASFGVSGLMADDLSLDPLFHRADMALYAAKANGRNAVVRYSDILKCDKQATDLRRHIASPSV
ncbi:GGDEF domain-containing protein [Shewanella sp. SP1S1-7]|uniref:tetratricopeptide repeat-containing diguanylate cyclase n=1 Tax=Shewanella sp. SP1S1-7 TaxID=3063536 RepID=UPI0028902103|nr:GGDEF domain-containing protein [Shewanella sp. SP1S1-7]MDT3335151.1 GGDEF domain-containing protein [Shewanella sp. SP1S1-7]